MRSTAVCWTGLLVLLVAPNAQAQEAGVSDERVLFGQSAALSGPAADLGQQIRLGVQAAFREINSRGGIHGRRLELRSLDDEYEPELAIVNTRALIEDEEDPVFALIGAVGTPTSRSATPVAAAAGVPYVAPFTGAEILRNKQWTNIVNLRASYYQETAEIVNHLISDLGIQRIAVLHQDDSYGRAGLRGVQQVLEQRKIDLAGVGSYVRNTTAVKTAILDLFTKNPEALILVGAYQPVASAIAWARRIGFDPVFVTISFSGGNALARALGLAGKDVFVTQVVPFPTSQERIAQVYRRALAAAAPDATPGFVSFEGYLAGRLAAVGLQRSGRDLSRARFLSELLSPRAISLDGFQLQFGMGDNQGSDAVFFTAIQEDGSYRPASGFDLVKER